jgi:hypothetical protein
MSFAGPVLLRYAPRCQNEWAPRGKLLKMLGYFTTSRSWLPAVETAGAGRQSYRVEHGLNLDSR